MALTTVSDQHVFISNARADDEKHSHQIYKALHQALEHMNTQRCTRNIVRSSCKQNNKEIRAFDKARELKIIFNNTR